MPYIHYVALYSHVHEALCVLYMIYVPDRCTCWSEPALQYYLVPFYMMTYCYFLKHRRRNELIYPSFDQISCSCPGDSTVVATEQTTRGLVGTARPSPRTGLIVPCCSLSLSLWLKIGLPAKLVHLTSNH